ncbi:mediator of RNA polymerase II transcription subunit 23 [Caerostris darwini]|uniref:Mediator of RNA polymerase II transcription subunit 23 n=1 Tax=Caerostris darwini TaxID=1538125 RepID=A0AAV4T1V7_9ARAC|nr:mediator of RNA polymerase II transcription subunit 23 [Caerostris darwini]
METNVSVSESKVESFVDGVLSESALAVAFHGYVKHSAEDQMRRYKTYQESLRNLLSSLSEADLAVALSHYVNLLSATKNTQKSKWLFALLEDIVTFEIVSARLVCETLLKCESLVYTNEDFWCFSFTLIDKIISKIDYKGVRDLLKTILDKAQGMKSSNNVAVMNQFRAIEKVLGAILDRNNCLLPSYLILDELQKKLPSKGSYPHWKFAKLITSFINSFRYTAQMVSVSVFMDIRGDETLYGKCKLLPVVGQSATLGNVWKLDPVTAKAPLRGLLPYNKELLEPQTSLLKYVLEQPYSREMVCNMLGVSKQQKQRCPVLEEQMVELIISAMEKSENELDNMEDGGPTQLLWQHLSSQLIYFVLFQYASFPHIIMILHKKLGTKLRKGRDHLMWVLLQFISGSIQKNQLSDFLPVMKLYDLLYPEKEPLPLPDITKASSTHALAITSIWIHLVKKAQVEKTTLTRRLPVALTNHLEFLQSSLNNNNLAHTLSTDYRVPLLCNAYSTNQDCFTRPMAILVEAVQGTQKQQASLTGGAVSGPITPLSMSNLDSLTVHTKMSLIHNIVTHVMKFAQAKSTHVLSPALVETYSRLLVYSEIESLGIKGFITHLLPTVFRSHAWSILHTLLEMFSYRLHHFQPHYRVQLLNHLHSLAAVPQTNQTQLHLCVQSTALKLIAGMGSAEVQPQLSRLPSEPKSLLSNESEELNKVLVLTIARAIHVTGSESLSGSWCKEILTTIMQHTPHSWSSFTLQCFPNVLADFFYHHQAPKENKSQLKRSVEEEYKKWKTMSNENDIITHFSGSSPLFLCLLWKMLLDNDRISTIAYQILDRIGARALSAHLRTFADFLVFEFAISPAGQHVNKYIDALNDLIWKCHVIQLDRLILCLALRSFESNEAQVCFLIIRMLLLKSQEFKNRVYDFVKNNSPEHWKQSDWHEKHLMFHRIYQEKFYFEGLHDLNAQHTYLPVYFGNVCLRFLPVMDIVIHRFLELPTVSISVEGLLDTLGCLYKFHDRPLTYLYNTLHYYEQKLRDRPPLKKKLVTAIVGSLKDIRADGWALSEGYINYAQDTSEELNWIPDHDYYVQLIGRLVDTLGGKSPFPHTDWRFNEFPNQGAHALHVTCIELMSLPVSPAIVGNAVLDVILKQHTSSVHSNIIAWMNAVGIVLTALPEAFWNILNDRILEVLQSPLLANPPPQVNPFMMFNFADSYNSMTEFPCSYLVALTHAVWYHASIGQICTLTQLLKTKFKPAVKNEVQFIFICQLVAPYLQRFYMERTRYAMEITVELYEMLETVDKNCKEIEYIDPICDLLYHIKYMFIGDSIKNEIEKSIRNLRPSIQRKLKFITHLNIEEESAA